MKTQLGFVLMQITITEVNAHVPYQNRKCTRRVVREGRGRGWIEVGKL